jgi:hypothetical protein
MRPAEPAPGAAGTRAFRRDFRIFSSRISSLSSWIPSSTGSPFAVTALMQIDCRWDFHSLISPDAISTTSSALLISRPPAFREAKVPEIP